MTAAIALVGLGAALIHGCQPRVDGGPLNLVVILIDTLRADHLGCYGYERRTSLNIDRLAGEGCLFENAIAQSSWTLPSAASLLTGLYPTRHGALHKRARLPLGRTTLAGILRAAGYATAAVVSHSLVSSDYGLDQGFEFFDESNVAGHLDVSSPGVTDVALQWLRSNARSPFFLFLHYFDPHYVYLEHEGYVFPTPYRGYLKSDVPFHTIQVNRHRLGLEGITCLGALYDSEIAFTDHHVGLVLEEIRRLGVDGSTLVVLTGDHGEEFMEHGWLGHTKHLYEETVRVPLIVRHPRWRCKAVSGPVELVDVMPTVLELVGQDVDRNAIDGRSFAGALRGKRLESSPAFSEVCYVDAGGRRDPDWTRSPDPNLRSVRVDSWKLVHDVGSQDWELFDLGSDPAERRNRTADPPGRKFEEMKALLVGWMAAQERLAIEENAVPDTIRVVDPEAERRLRALGYVD